MGEFKVPIPEQNPEEMPQAEKIPENQEIGIEEKIAYQEGIIDASYSSAYNSEGEKKELEKLEAKIKSSELNDQKTKNTISYLKGFIENFDPKEREKARHKAEKKIKKLEKEMQNPPFHGWKVEKVKGGFKPIHSDYNVDAEVCKTEEEARELIEEFEREKYH